MVPVPSKNYTYDGLSFTLRDAGQGQPVLFLAGWGYGSLMGEVACAGLRAEGLRVITVDLPGTGSMADASSFVSLPRLARALAGILRDELQLHQVMVVGHSFGSMLAQEMALSEDDLVGSLVLVSVMSGVGGMVPDLQTAMGMFNRLLAGDANMLHHLLEPPFLAHLRRVLGGSFTELDKPIASGTLSGQVWAASRWTNFGRMSQIYQPTLILQGDHDAVASPEKAHAIATLLPRAQLKILDECGFLPFIECPERTTAALLKFIAQQTADDAATEPAQ